MFSHWEHAEFVIPESFEELMKKYPMIAWDTSSANRSNYSHLKVSLMIKTTQVPYNGYSTSNSTR